MTLFGESLGRCPRCGSSVSFTSCLSIRENDMDLLEELSEQECSACGLRGGPQVFEEQDVFLGLQGSVTLFSELPDAPGVPAGRSEASAIDAQGRRIPRAALRAEADFPPVLFAGLQGLVDVHSLDFTDSRVLTDGDLAAVREFANLRALVLYGCGGVTHDGLGYLSGLDFLEELHLGGCRRIADNGLHHLGGLPALSRLGLGTCSGLNGCGLVHLQSLPALREIVLCGCDGFTEEGTGHLAYCDGLERIDLTRSRGITAAGLEGLTGLPHLRRLDLSLGTDVREPELRALAATGAFRIAPGPCRGDAGDRGPRRLESSEREVELIGSGPPFALRIEGIGVHEGLLRWIGSREDLSALDLRWTDFDGSGIDSLREMKRLEHLGLPGPGLLPQEAVDLLTSALPECRIERP